MDKRESMRPSIRVLLIISLVCFMASYTFSPSNQHWTTADYFRIVALCMLSTAVGER